uniref:Uncharacterized protein n=1 Tax=Oryza punctata TaxID=4537 RepID=A0A0E0JXZ9_ORYPU
MDVTRNRHQRFWVMAAEDGRLGFSAQFWKKKKKKKTGCEDDVSGWVLQKTIDLGKLLSLSSTGREDDPALILGFSEDHIVMFLKTYAGLFMIHLKSMEFKKLPENDRINLAWALVMKKMACIQYRQRVCGVYLPP